MAKGHSALALHIGEPEIRAIHRAGMVGGQGMQATQQQEDMG